MRCKHDVVINRCLELKCRIDCNLEDLKECRTIWQCSYDTTGLHCLFCSVEYFEACWEKHEEFKQFLVDLAFGC